jgi:uncharacterized protein YgfB (UPF0149 family)
MTLATDHDDLDAALRRCGSHWGGAQAHGLLCGRLAVLGADGAGRWRDQVLESLDPADALRIECEMALDALFQETWRQLVERQSEFDLLLPGETEDAAVRTRALADWCEGFLHGLVSESHSEAVRKRLAAEPLADLIRDMLEITRATVGDEDEETTESSYTELVEYIRVAAQLAYEQLEDVRGTPLSPAAIGGSSDTLH